jgi:hypothetical protein
MARPLWSKNIMAGKERIKNLFVQKLTGSSSTPITTLAGLFQGAVAAGGTTVLQAKNGVTKIHNRPNADGYALEVKSEPTVVTGTHFGIECTVDAKPSTATSAAGIRGGGFIGRLAATYTMTGGSLIGGYSQACNLGTINGASAMVAGHYTLIEDGGTFTAVDHLAGAWIDSHLTKTVSAGIKDMLYITNNGTTQFDNVMYIYPGNKITNLFTIESTDTGLVSAKTDADIAYAHYRKVNVNVHGQAGWILVGFDS